MSTLKENIYFMKMRMLLIPKVSQQDTVCHITVHSQRIHSILFLFLISCILTSKPVVTSQNSARARLYSSQTVIYLS